LTSSLKQSGDFTEEKVYYLLLLLVSLRFVFEVHDFVGLLYFLEISIMDLWPKEIKSSSLYSYPKLLD
jgi:hypothetical protein